MKAIIVIVEDNWRCGVPCEFYADCSGSCFLSGYQEAIKLHGGSCAEGKLENICVDGKPVELYAVRVIK